MQSMTGFGTSAGTVQGVEYDVEATADKILAMPDIDPILADRLRRGK